MLSFLLFLFNSLCGAIGGDLYITVLIAGDVNGREDELPAIGKK